MLKIQKQYCYYRVSTSKDVEQLELLGIVVVLSHVQLFAFPGIA